VTLASRTPIKAFSLTFARLYVSWHLLTRLTPPTTNTNTPN